MNCRALLKMILISLFQLLLDFNKDYSNFITMIDLCRIKEDFSVLVKEAQPWTLTQFVMWLDLKLSEFKIKGYMVLGMNIDIS
jgi:hypothetical protein